MRILLLSLVFAILLAGATWIVRGIYDRIFMLEGYFMVINVTPKEQLIRVRFPSGISHQRSISSRGSHTFRVRGTGEGAVSVFLDDTEIPLSYSYVTSHNPPMVLVVEHDKVSMFHYSPGLKLDYLEDGGLSR